MKTSVKIQLAIALILIGMILLTIFQPAIAQGRNDADIFRKERSKMMTFEKWISPNQMIKEEKVIAASIKKSNKDKKKKSRSKSRRDKIIARTRE